MDYYKDLKQDDFESYAGFTFHQCQLHRLIDLSLAFGLSQADILAIVGPDTGYIFSCVPTST